MEVIKTEVLLPVIMDDTVNFATENVKTEQFVSEDVELDTVMMDEKQIKTEENSIYGIVVEDGILDFQNEDCEPEKKIPESEPSGHPVQDKAEERRQPNFFTEQFQNLNTLEEGNKDCTGNIPVCFQQPVKKENGLAEDRSNSKDFRGESSFSQEDNLGNFSFDKDKLFRCAECGFSCGENSDLITHIRSFHKKANPLNCTECTSTFSRKSHLERHIRAVHEKVKAFRCSECKHSFSWKNNLVIHMRAVHNKDKKFQCNECEYSCCEKSTLETHIRSVHMKEKPFICAECGTAFSRKSHLTRHDRLVHEKVRSFGCTECNSSFSIKSHLARHNRLVHDK